MGFHLRTFSVVAVASLLLHTLLRYLHLIFEAVGAVTIRALFLPILMLIFSNVAIGATPKECLKKLDPNLVKLLEIKFPHLRIPRLADLDQQSINFDIQGGGDGCFVVAEGDFDGDQRQDLAVLLTSISKKDAHLIVALKRGKTWAVHQLPTFCDTIQFCYVKPEKPGTYIRSVALDSPPSRPNERVKLTSKTTSVLSGTLESTGIVYVYSKGRWNYVWVSD